MFSAIWGHLGAFWHEGKLVKGWGRYLMLQQS